MIYLSSDYHFNHDKEFVWKERGFVSVQEMNEAIVERHNKVVTQEDTIFILGDVMLGGSTNISGLDYLKRMNGNKIIIAGNHDTDKRIQLYEELNIPVYYAQRLKYGKYHFYLSHYPTITANYDEKTLKQCTLNLYGHTHQKDKFYNNNPTMFHCGVDSNDCYPISIESIIQQMKLEIEIQKKKEG